MSEFLSLFPTWPQRKEDLRPHDYPGRWFDAGMKRTEPFGDDDHAGGAGMVLRSSSDGLQRREEGEMSIDRKTVDFLEKLNSDENLRSRMTEAMENAPDRREAAYQFATSEGFEVTREGLDSAATAFGKMNELGDAELEQISGGFNPQPEPPRDTVGDDYLKNYQVNVGSIFGGW